jgi:hypothetical protein
MFKSHLTKPGRLHVLLVIEIGSAGNCLDVVGVSGGYERESAVPSSSSVRDFSSGGGPSGLLDAARAVCDTCNADSDISCPRKG